MTKQHQQQRSFEGWGDGLGTATTLERHSCLENGIYVIRQPREC